MAFSNLFTSMVEKNDVRRIVSVRRIQQELNEKYKEVVPRIWTKGMEAYEDFKNFPGESYVDLLSFVSIHLWRDKLSGELAQNTEKITETQLLKIMTQLSMTNMPVTVLDTCKANKDSMGRKLYKSHNAIIQALKVHVVSLQYIFDNLFKDIYRLPTRVAPENPYLDPNNRSKYPVMV